MIKTPDSPAGWLDMAQYMELLAVGLRLPTLEQLATPLSNGDFSTTLGELGAALGLPQPTLTAADEALRGYAGRDPEPLFHTLRIEHTRLFVGAPTPAVSPYAGYYQAQRDGVKFLLFVNPRSMEIERYLRSFGIGQAEGKNEPLDQISSMLEFLQYQALVLAGSVAPGPDAETISADTFNHFATTYLANFLPDFCATLDTATQEPLYTTLSTLLRATFL
jgi:TorA maturation chaperone TorD